MQEQVRWTSMIDSHLIFVTHHTCRANINDELRGNPRIFAQAGVQKWKLSLPQTVGFMGRQNEAGDSRALRSYLRMVGLSCGRFSFANATSLGSRKKEDP